MRISNLLTDFLYQKKQLNIPGIGTFSIDPGITIPDPDDKTYDSFLLNIRFEQKSILQPDEALVDFIRAQTGKIRPLALADLDSLLSDYRGLLNLGKPVHLEGIGTLNRLRSGKIEFTPGAPAAEQIDLYNDESKRPKAKEKKEKTSESTSEIKVNWSAFKKPVAIIAGISGFFLVLAGGYYLYQNTSKKAKPAATPVAESKITPETETPPSPSVTDSFSIKPKDTVAKGKDTVKPIVVPPTPNPTPAQTQTPTVTPPSPTTPVAVVSGERRNFKFILQQTSRREIAENNFSKVRMSQPNIRMETKDSITYRIYLIQSCKPSDTARTVDSLNLWYWGKRERKVTIEK